MYDIDSKLITEICLYLASIKHYDQLKTTISTLFILLLGNALWGQSLNFTEEEQEWIKNHPKIEFGYEPDYLPYEIYKDGKYTGVVGDFIKVIESKTGIEMDPIPNVDWKQTTNGLKSGEIKMAPAISAIDPRTEYMVFTEPYLEDPFVIAINEKEYVGSIEDLYGKTVVIPFGYTTNEILKKNHPEIKILNKSSVEECLKALTFEEADAFIGNLGVINYFIYQRGFTNLKIAAPFGKDNIQLRMGFVKEWKTFRDICQKVLNNISPRERSEIRNTWIAARQERSFSDSTTFKWGVIIVMSLTVLLGIIYLWNRSLKNQIREKEKAQATLKESFAQIQAKNEEKKVLLQEIHHRVKNNLQITTSMLRMQKNLSENDEVKRSLKDAMDRIKSISLIHEKIYTSESLNSVNPKNYLESLGEEILQSFSGGKKVDLIIETEGGNVFLKKMVSVALIVNELITNSIKHGFKNKAHGTIQISLTQNNYALTMVYLDDGTWIENPESNNFGTSLIQTFTEQLEGKFDFSTENGTRYNFVFPEN